MRNKFLLATVIWVVFITYACLAAAADIPKASWLNVPYLDKIVHFIFYFILTLLLSIDFKVKTETIKKAWLYAFAIAVGYGIIIEICQRFLTKGRSADVIDALANMSGSAFAIFILWFLQKRKK